MEFPHYFHVFGLTIHPHPVMEGLAYAVALGAVFILRARRRELSDERSRNEALWLMAAAAVGAVIGAKLLGWIEGPAPATFDRLLTGGRTIVGGLAGAWLATEIGKKILGIRRRTGDAWVMPLCVAIAIGRVGCFLTGLSDNTYGVASSLPWAVDFGDHIRRHPTQLYESVFAAGLAVFFLALGRRRFWPGARFRIFLLAYMMFRLGVEFLKPSNKPYAGLSAIQWAAIGCIVAAVVSLSRGPGVAVAVDARTE